MKVSLSSQNFNILIFTVRDGSISSKYLVFCSMRKVSTIIKALGEKKETYLCPLKNSMTFEESSEDRVSC